MSVVDYDDPQYLELEWSEESDQLSVPHAVVDRYEIRKRRYARALQIAERLEEFDEQFSVLINALVRWMHKRSDIAGGYLTMRDGSFLFAVVRTACEYDEEFEDSLSDLDIKLANDGDLNLLKVDAIGLPPASDAALSSFLDPDNTLKLPTSWRQKPTI